MESLYNFYYLDNGVPFRQEKFTKERVISFVDYCLDMGFEITGIINVEDD